MPAFLSNTGFQPVALHRPEAGAAGATNQGAPPLPSCLRLIASIHRFPHFSAWQRPPFCRI